MESVKIRQIMKKFLSLTSFLVSMAVSHFTKKILVEFNEPTFNFILLSNDFDESDGGGARHFQASLIKFLRFSLYSKFRSISAYKKFT